MRVAWHMASRALAVREVAPHVAVRPESAVRSDAVESWVEAERSRPTMALWDLAECRAEHERTL